MLRDLPAQANDLINKMVNDDRIDVDNDWKLVTLLIGGNDMCDYCKNKVMYGMHVL